MKQDKKIALPKVPKQSKDLVAEKKEQLKKLFPEAFEEDKLSFEELKKTLGEAVASNGERFGLQWSGKAECYQTIQRRSNATLKPNLAKENEQNFLDNASENIFIEGDNLEVLKLLQESYFGKVKMIYIDPPYNTGKEFIYPDNHKDNLKTYLEYTGQLDENGKKFSTNTEQEGRFHSNWLSMMYPRLFLARNLITEDGVIFISIDDNEQANLKKICDQIFGEDNFVANIVWNRKRGRDNSAKYFSKSHEYLVVVAKNKGLFKTNYLKLDNTTKKAYKNPDNDSRGNYRILAVWARGTQGGVKYDFTDKHKQYFPTRLWLMSKENLIKLDNENKLIINEDNIYRKLFLSENKGKIPETIWSNISNAANASDEIKNIFANIIFDTAKPIPYVQEMLQIATNKNDIILDFFAGSCTTADAVMQLNAEDGGTRKFIMVQLPEPCKEDSEAFQAGFSNIAEIGKERIRRAAKKIKKDLQDKIVTFSQKVAKLEEKNKKATAEASQEIIAEIEKHQQEILTLKERAKNLDLGFQSFQLTSSNFEEWQTDPQQLKNGELKNLQLKNLQQALQTQTNPVKKNSKDLDLLFEILLKEGIELAAKITSKTIAGKKVYFVAEHNFYICLEKINLEWMEEILKKEPAKIILLDSGFGEDDELKINCFQKIQILEQQKEQSIILKTI